MSQLPPLTSLKASLLSDGHLLHIELDHGRANEMGSQQLSDWEALTDWLPGSGVRAIITFSRRRSRRGTPIFIAGANVTERIGWSDAKVRTHVRWQRSVLRKLRTAPIFHIAVVDGVALGWGAEMMIAVDYRIAGPGAAFALPETGLGILPGAGGTSELWAMIGVPQAMRLGMTGEKIDAVEALRIGLIQEVVESLDAGLERAHALAEKVSRRSPTAIGAFKRAMLFGIGQTSEQRAELEARAYELCMKSGDAAVGRANFKAIISGEEVQWNSRRLLSS